MNMNTVLKIARPVISILAIAVPAVQNYIAGQDTQKMIKDEVAKATEKAVAEAMAKMNAEKGL